MHVEMGLASMFAFRPTPALSGYRVPGLPGLYLAGASTHPGGGVSGNSGRTAARVAPRRSRARSPGPAARRPGAAAGSAAVRSAPDGARAVTGAGPPRRPAVGPRRRCRCCSPCLLVLTAIAYPLTSGSGRDAVSWTIVVLGATLSVAHAALSRGLRTGLGVLLLVAVTAVAFEAVGLATGFPYGSYTYADTLGPDPARRAVPRAAGLADDGLAELGAGRAAGPAGAAGLRRAGAHRRRRRRLRRLGRRPRSADGPGRLLDVGAPAARGCPGSTPCR